MKFDILTLFPKMFSSPFQESILGKAIEKGLIQIRTINIRDFTSDKHQVVDDTPYGGGQGMVMKGEPIARAIEWIKSQNPSVWTIYLTPQGKPFNQKMAQELSNRSHLILLCGRYEGIDDRVRKLFADEEISIGDYVLTGGELAAMVLMDAISRLLPGVLGSDRSAAEEFFFQSLFGKSQPFQRRQGTPKRDRSAGPRREDRRWCLTSISDWSIILSTIAGEKWWLPPSQTLISMTSPVVRGPLG